RAMRYLFKYDRWLRDENCRCPSRVYVAAMPLSAADYRPRDAEHAVLYRVIDEHLEAFLETARRNADGSPLPEFVEQEFRDFLTCGVLARGFARLRCTDSSEHGDTHVRTQTAT